ncbi:MAG: alpha-galactosidase [Bacteroidetes bacterium]|nr:alpha-galactosidase [Bacteroidota bacterium]
MAFYVVLCCTTILTAYGQLSELPIWEEQHSQIPSTDWLINPTSFKAGVFKSSDGKDIILSNGLTKRSFRIAPNLTCFDYTNVVNGQQLIRAVRPEARITLNGTTYAIGGLSGQKEQAYLKPAWLDNMEVIPNAFKYSDFNVTTITPNVNWKKTFWSSGALPPTGVRVIFEFIAPAGSKEKMKVNVVYDVYDGIPLMVKWIELKNLGNEPVRIDRVVNEILAFSEEESAVVGTPDQMKKQHGIYVETNYAFNNAMRYDISDQTTHWKIDSTYTSQVNYNYQTPCLLEIYPEKAPGIKLQPGETFTSVRSHELLMDSYDRERRGLAIRRMYRTVAPWTTQNPIFMHLISRTDEEVRAAVDQCAETGYEAVILSFGSHLNMEDQSIENLNRWKTLADYAHSKNIKLGGYSLFSSRKISDNDDVVDPKTGKPGGAFFGHAPCFGSNWGLAYRDKIKKFFEYTGFDLWENDGPYPGDVCASRNHPGHEDLADSQWKQMEIQKELYRWLNERGVYINAPDWYFMDGTHKIAIGYREVNFSLSREQQIILNRQNIFDGTFEKTSSMGWGFVPLTKYHGGGPESVLEPLEQHLNDYEQLMFQYYSAGVQACYRGPRLFDTEKTKQTVQSMIAWYKQYRNILNADIIHLRRADGRDWDGWLHLNPNASIDKASVEPRGMLVLFNPTEETIKRKIRVPLYYGGMNQSATFKEKDGKTIKLSLNNQQEAALEFTIPARGYTWYAIN